MTSILGNEFHGGVVSKAKETEMKHARLSTYHSVFCCDCGSEFQAHQNRQVRCPNCQRIHANHKARLRYGGTSRAQRRHPRGTKATPVTISLTENNLFEIDRLAKTRGIPRSRIIQEMIFFCLKKE